MVVGAVGGKVGWSMVGSAAEDRPLAAPWCDSKLGTHGESRGIGVSGQGMLKMAGVPWWEMVAW